MTQARDEDEVRVKLVRTKAGACAKGQWAEVEAGFVGVEVAN